MEYYSTYNHESGNRSIHIGITKTGKLYIDGKHIQGASIWLWDTLKDLLAAHDITKSFATYPPNNSAIIRRHNEAKKAINNL